MMLDLKPCPFCGGEAEMYITKPVPHTYAFNPRCKKDSCCGRTNKKYAERQTAIKSWNKRAAQFYKKTCQDCGSVFNGAYKRKFCNDCLKLRQSERAKAMNLNKIGVDAHVAKTTGRREDDG